MRLRESIDEAIYRGDTPVIPFFPFPVADRQAAFDFLLRLAATAPPEAIGLVYPGEAALDEVPARTVDPQKFSEWDLFQFIYALKHQAGLPVVLAIHYQDVIRFGVIPYSQEGHRVGIDALLIRDPEPAEMDFFSSELAVGGVGLAVMLSGGMSEAAIRDLLIYANAFAYFPDGLPGWMSSGTVPEALPRFTRTGTGPEGGAGGSGRILEQPLGAHIPAPRWNDEELQTVIRLMGRDV